MFARHRIMLVVIIVAILGVLVSACSNDKDDFTNTSESYTSDLANAVDHDASIQVSNLQLVKANVVVRIEYEKIHNCECGYKFYSEEHDFVCNEYSGTSHGKPVSIYEYLSERIQPQADKIDWSPLLVSKAMNANGHSSNTTLTFVGHVFSTFALGESNNTQQETGPNVFIVRSYSS